MKVVVPQGVTNAVTLSNLTLMDYNVYEGFCAFALRTDACVSLLLEGENIIQSTSNRAGVEVPAGASLSITNAPDDSAGTLLVYGGYQAAGIGSGKGENRMVQAAKNAVASPLLETKIDGARAVLINITGGEDMPILDINEAARLIQEAADSEANIIFGAGVDNSLKDEVRITVIATGFEKTAFPAREAKKKPFKASVPYGTATASYNPYENRAPVDVPDANAPAFEAPQVPAMYDQQDTSGFFPTPGRPAGPVVPQMPSPQPYMQQGYQPQQPYAPGYTPGQAPYVQQANPYQPPVRPQQPFAAEKDDLGVPAYLRRGTKK